jgi:hypothetical protein
MNYLELLKPQIADIIKQSAYEEDPSHSVNTREWVLKLDPNASEALQIAALSHDIDRAIQPRTLQLENESYDDYKSRHAKRSAELIIKLMEHNGCPFDLIQHVGRLVENHEIGGDPESDILMDADSISYFDNSLAIFLARKGKEYTKFKIGVMFERCSPRAQEVIRSLNLKPELNELLSNAIKA